MPALFTSTSTAPRLRHVQQLELLGIAVRVCHRNRPAGHERYKGELAKPMPWPAEIGTCPFAKRPIDVPSCALVPA